jgi:hypothetical protein
MSNAHAQQYYFGSGTETTQGSGIIDSYEVGPADSSIAAALGDVAVPHPGLNVPLAQDKQRGSS